MKKQEPSRICISMDNDFEIKLRDMAKHRGITLSSYIRKIISEKWQKNNY